MACLHDCDGWQKCSHLTVEDDGSFIECGKGMDICWDGDSMIRWLNYESTDCEHHDPEPVPTSCAYWSSKFKSSHRKCGTCDACQEQGCQEYHARKEEGLI